jgi:mevalonate kinase
VAGSLLIRRQALIRKNAILLEDLEVGHAALETVRVKTAAVPYNLSTKLTGAGGGGCALTLIPDGSLARV